MTLAVIDLNDAGIEIGIDGELVATSPGFSVIDGDRLMIGNEAAACARRLPRWTNNRFWNQLNTDPLPQATSTIRHHADLALEHLESIWNTISDRADHAVILVPGYYEHAQLGLLLGIAKEAGIPVKGVADASLVSVCEHADQATTLHLDTSLHRITLGNMTSGSNLVRHAYQTVTENGLFTLWDRWANIVANQFIQSSRFDPLHEASTEQALYDRLPEWIREHGNTGGGVFEISNGESSYKVSISTDQLMHACAQIYPQLVQAVRSQVEDETTLLLSHRFAGFPGLKDSLSLINGLNIVELTPGQGVRNAFSHAENILARDGAVTHVVNLPISRKRTAQLIPPLERATHLLLNGQAIAVNRSLPLSANLGEGFRLDPESAACHVYTRAGDLYLQCSDQHKVRLNGEQVAADAILTPGDVIDIGEFAVNVIAVG